MSDQQTDGSREEAEFFKTFSALRQASFKVIGSLADRVVEAIERTRTTGAAPGPSLGQLLVSTLIQSLNLLTGSAPDSKPKNGDPTAKEARDDGDET